MRLNSVTLGLGLLFVVLLLCSSTVDGSSQALNRLKEGRKVDEKHAKGLAATARYLAKRQLMKDDELKAEEKYARMVEEKMSKGKVAEKWRKRDYENFDEIIGKWLDHH